ncbi:MAG: ATP-binding protein [Thermodesulfobacteriota bacterium]|nr:ATP-binding protein [Thermodesulfobacteriota bacterium]
MYIPRHAESTVKTLLAGFPIVVVTGPRQSGKSTLAARIFDDRPYVSLEDPDQELFANEDPRGFLERFKDGAVLDEVQRCPHLLSYLQTLVDRDGRTNLFLLTGSQQFGLMAEDTQTLAGRAGMMELLQFSIEELMAVDRLPSSLESLLYKGFYPPLYDRPISPALWFPNYIRTYVERDVRQMVNVSDLTVFQRFVYLCAGRSGQLLNLTSLANDCGIAPNTAKSWLSVLRASYIVYLLPPYFKNYNKRLIKTPKLYFYDTGLAARLLGIEKEAQLVNHAYRGPLFETLVVGELLKMRFNTGQPSNLYFWRDRTGNEVDVLMDRGDCLVPVEIKSGRTITASYFKGLLRWVEMAGSDAGKAHLVYAGSEQQTRRSVAVVPWQKIAMVGDI